jgi:hypothetical protein
MEHCSNGTDSRISKCPQRNLFQCHFVHHKSHMDWPAELVVACRLSEPPVHRYTGTQVHRYTVTPVHRYTGTPVHRYTGTPLHRYTGTPVHRYTGTPVHRYTGTPVHRYSQSRGPSCSVTKPTGRCSMWQTGMLFVVRLS